MDAKKEDMEALKKEAKKEDGMEKKVEKKEDAVEAKKEDGMEKKESADHPDEEQDTELFKKLIAKALGDHMADDEEAMKCVKECHEGYKEMGYSHGDAMKACEHSLRLANHMGSKKEATKEAKKEDAVEKKEAGQKDPSKLSPESKKDAEDEECKKESKEDSIEAKKEDGMEKKESIAAVKAENEKLREALKTREIADKVETLCSKSGLERSVTKSFKILIEGEKSLEVIEAKWAKFLENETESKRTSKILESTGSGFSGFVISADRNSAPSTSSSGGFGQFVK